MGSVKIKSNESNKWNETVIEVEFQPKGRGGQTVVRVVFDRDRDSLSISALDGLAPEDVESFCDILKNLVSS